MMGRGWDAKAIWASQGSEVGGGKKLIELCKKDK